MTSIRRAEELLEQDRRFDTDYSNPELRRARGLPLQPIDMSLEVTGQDLEMGATWPPQRMADRVERQRLRQCAVTGDYSPWLPTYGDLGLEVSISPLADWLEDVSAVLFTTDPTPNDSPEVTQMTINALERMTWDICIHGRGLIVGNATEVVGLPIADSWPVEGGGWLWVSLHTGTDPDSDRVNEAHVRILKDGSLDGLVYEWEGSPTNGSFGVPKRILPSLTGVRAGIADAAPQDGSGWGISRLDKLIPIAVEMARRESGISYVLDANERPMFQVEVANADTGGALSAIPGRNGPLNEAEVRRNSPQLRQHNVKVWGDGTRNASMLTWDSSMASSFQFLDRLDRLLTRATGFAPVEAADGAGVESGIAVARRNARGVARTRQIWIAERAALDYVRGTPSGWEYVDTMLAQPSTQGNPDPEATAAAL